ncbi:MAG: hypothetical protein M5R36_14065 [Deltaproteobacteria bacterium]|nr:hypothetical protein [Deltaproteobacteria bacterium]
MNENRRGDGAKRSLGTHFAVWSAAAAVYALLGVPMLRIVALETETFVQNQYEIQSLHTLAWIPRGWVASLAGPAPFIVIVLAAFFYRPAERFWQVGNPIWTWPQAVRLSLGAVAVAGLAAFAVPLSIAMVQWIGVEAYWWIEWYGGMLDVMERIRIAVPPIVIPGTIIGGATFLWWALGAPTRARTTDGGPILALRYAYYVVSIPLLTAFAATWIVGGPRLLRASSSPGYGDFTNNCGKCHERSSSFNLIKTPAEWKKTVDMHFDAKQIEIKMKDEERQGAWEFLLAMRSYSDEWTFRTRCQRCHVVSYLDWDKRRPEDWETIVGRIAWWSPFYYRTEVRDQVLAYLGEEFGDPDALLGLDRESYERFMRFGNSCGRCHSISRGAEYYREADAPQVQAMVERMSQKLPEPLSGEEIVEFAATYQEVLADTELFGRLFPHDLPTEEDEGK